MNLKIIAREILILFSVVLLTGLLYVGLHTHNYIINKRVEKQDFMVKNYETSIDSLNELASTLLVDNSIYKFLKENDLTKQESNEFLNTYSKPDSSVIIYNFFKTNNLTDLSQEEFCKKYLNPKDAETLIAINELIKLNKNDLALETEKRLRISKNLLTSDNIFNLSLTLLILLSVIVYPLRFSFLTIKWAIKTLKKK